MKNTGRMLISTTIACAAFLVMLFLINLHPIISGIISVALYLGLDMLLKPSVKLGGVDVQFIIGGKEMQKLIEDAKDDLNKIESDISAINSQTVKDDADKLYQTGKSMLEYLQENPKKIALARRFFTYYLDTAVSLLNRYVQLQKTDLHTSEINSAMQKTAEALPIMNSAFEKQFTHLMEGELMDVEADVDLLEKMMKMEGGL